MIRRLLPPLALLGALVACGGAGTIAVVPAGEPARVSEAAVPKSVMGLAAAPVDVSSQLEQASDRAFISDLRMWSLREGSLLRATVEVGRFTPDARPGSPRFREAMAAQLGSAQPRLRRIDDQLVYVAPGNAQTLFLWFRGVNFVLLGVSTEYPAPRALVRAAIKEVTP